MPCLKTTGSHLLTEVLSGLSYQIKLILQKHTTCVRLLVKKRGEHVCLQEGWKPNFLQHVRLLCGQKQQVFVTAEWYLELQTNCQRKSPDQLWRRETKLRAKKSLIYTGLRHYINVQFAWTTAELGSSTWGLMARPTCVSTRFIIVQNGNYLNRSISRRDMPSDDP